jgi:hypothetical protein
VTGLQEAGTPPPYSTKGTHLCTAKLPGCAPLAPLEEASLVPLRRSLLSRGALLAHTVAPSCTGEARVLALGKTSPKSSPRNWVTQPFGCLEKASAQTSTLPQIPPTRTNVPPPAGTSVLTYPRETTLGRGWHFVLVTTLFLCL